MPHSYGYIPDKLDRRDFTFTAPQKIDQLPPSVDMRKYCSPVRDQGNLGSCTGFAIGSGLREFVMIKNTPPPLPMPAPEPESCLSYLMPKGLLKGLKHDPTQITVLSPLFLYYQERLLEGTINEDSGAEMRDGFVALKQTGISPEDHYPYVIADFDHKPGLSAYTDAPSFKISLYQRIIGLINMKSCLAVGGGLAIGFKVYESFETEEMAQTGRMSMPKANEQLLGGHAVFCCGYVDDIDWPGGGYLIIKNSWGVGWGDAGFFYLPYAYAEDPEQVSDIWTATV
jgi:C1A family cysteine protease